MTDKSDLDLIASYVASGATVLVLGPNFSAGSLSLAGQPVPVFQDFAKEAGRVFGLDASDFSGDEEIIDYLTRHLESEHGLRQYMRTRFGVRRAASGLSILPRLVWRRIYSFDLTDSIDLVYRQNHLRVQTPRLLLPDSPVTPIRSATQVLDFIKLNGDGLSESSHNAFTRPDFTKFSNLSKWHSALKLDCEVHPVVFLGNVEDRDFLFNELRSLQRTAGRQRIVFVCPDIKPHQLEMLKQQDGIYVNGGASDFLLALAKVFPNGRTLDDIATATAGFTLGNRELRDNIATSFLSLTQEKFDRSSLSPEMEGGIYAFYKGEPVRWSDVVLGIHADLAPVRNWRNRIALELEKGFPAAKTFLLTSPAGMGKSVGLMSVAHWLRQRTDLPILWLEPDGDLKGFLLKTRREDFPRGVFVFVDDLTLHIEGFENVPAEAFSRMAFICASRETRWQKYRRRMPLEVEVVAEGLRKLNRKDAEELHSKISRYGTTVHFTATDREGQVDEILARSQRDMLVLVRELGQGRKFDSIVKSEIVDLDVMQRLAYLVVCLSDRNQVPLPIDLLAYAVMHSFPDANIPSILDSMGRMVDQGAGRRTVRTRHAIIAHHTLEPKNSVVPPGEIKDAVRALLHGFSNYQIPIVVHHSNTGHARVFKAVINRRFLAEVLGVGAALDLYREFEKLFERDGFFWQQYGLCQTQAGNYEPAVETLRHAFAVHQHFQIKHSLGAACLLACSKLGPQGLHKNDFEGLREEGRSLLRELHEETGFREDKAIATLIELDVDVAMQFDDSDAFKELTEQYHRILAFYVRDHPQMDEAKRVYERLYAYLSKASSVDPPDYDEVLETA